MPPLSLRSLFRSLAALLLSAVALTPAGASTLSASAVTIHQLNFRTAPNSVVAEITVDYGAAGGSGFVNVINPAMPNDMGWLVRNLPVFPGTSGYDNGNLTTRFDLTPFIGHNGVSLASVSLLVDYDPSPSAASAQVLSHAPVSQLFTVTTVDNATGGTGPGASANVGYQVAPNVFGVAFAPGGLPILQVIYQRQHPNVQTAHNQCAPAAVANSLKFLSNTTALVLPHVHAKGWGGDVPNNTLVGQLDVTTGRTLGANRCDGVGNSGVWPMDGKLTYIANNKLKIGVKHRVGGWANNLGTALNGGANYTKAGITSTGAGAAFDIGWILTELQNGADVELDLAWANGARHYVEVVGAGYILGVPFLLHVSDHQQCSFKAAPNGWNVDPNDVLGTGGVDFEWINNANGFAANSNAWIDQILSETYTGP